MKILHVVVGMGSVMIMVVGTGVVSGQTFPNRPVRIVASGAGSGGDVTARIIAPGLSSVLGQPVVVENRAAGIPRAEIVARALPDGHTIMISGSALWIGPFIEKAPFDPVRDFAPITMADTSPSLVVVNPSLPIKSIKDLIALAKAKPGTLNYVSGSTGSAPHLATELFKAMAGVDIVRVPYKAFGAGITDLVAGQVQVAIPGPAPVVPFISTGRLRALAVTSAKPSALFPELPTVAATGLPGYEFAQISGIFAPAKTPAAIIKRLNQEIVRVLNSAEVKEKIIGTGSEVVGSSPEQLAATIKSEMARLGKVIKDAGIKAD